MIRNVFNAIHSYWLTPQELETIPATYSDLKVTSVVESFFDAPSKHIIQKGPQEVLFNHKTDKFYSHLSQDQLGFQLVWYLCTAWIELAFHIVLNFCETTKEIVNTFAWNDFYVSSLGVIVQYLGSCYETLRVVYYGVPLYIALIEGVFFNPIAGALKVELLEAKLNFDLHPQDDTLVKWGSDWLKWMKGEYKPESRITNQFKFYKCKSVIAIGSVDDKISSNECQETNQFTQRTRAVKQECVEGYFPLAQFISRQCQTMLTAVMSAAIPVQ